MKKLKVDLDEIAMEIDRRDDFGSTILFDTETGQIVSIPDELMRAVEEDDEEALENLPEWEKDLIETAKSICSDEAGRYEEIPKKPSYEAYDLMVEFAETVKDIHLKEKLNIALDGKGAFRRFKNVLSDYPEEQERWFAFKDERMRQEVIDWLNSLDIEPI
ncbi:MAG: UPF0158 family protein [Proteobacteria bacterium]|nr:UPF0158 family protein [Pseudomonadota bacterium]